MIPSIIYLPAIIGIFLIGLLTVYQKSVKGILYFSAMAFSMAVWLFFQYLAQLSAGSAAVLFFIQMSSAVSNLLPIFFYFFIRNMTAGVVRKRSAIILITFAVIFTVCNFTGLMITKASADELGISVEEAGSLYFVQILFSFVLYVYGLIKVLRYKKKVEQNERRKYSLLAIAVGQALLVTVLGSTVLATSSLVQIFIVQSFFIMVIMIGYAIIRHRLFDVRLIVARSIAYIGTVAILGGFYGWISFTVLGGVFFRETEIPLAQEIIQVFVMLVTAFCFPYVKSLFDKLTNRLFYRDAYDPQLFLNELNKMLVSSVDIEILLTRCAEVITQNIKADYCLFGLKETDYFEQRVIGNKEVNFTNEDISLVRSITPKTHQTIILTDALEPGSELRKKLQKYDIAMLARLTPDITSEVEGLGYLVLGQKKSGNPYNKQDIRMIEIIANELVIAIQNALRFEEIQKFNITLQEKIEDATKQLKRTNEKLQALDEAKDEFISMASHQLRTPLTSVKGYLSMVIEGDAGKVSQAQKKFLTQAFDSSQRMVYLIADLLNVSRLKTGKFVIEKSPSNLAEMIEGEIGQLTETAASRNLKLIYEKPKDFPTLMLDETKTRQVIMNFTDNAIYYTPAGGTITVNLKDTGQTVEFTVVDNGLGVPKAEQHHLFNKFYRAGNARKARPDGTGLGLFMAKKVIVAQGGSIIFKSIEGKGSTFGFSFSKAKLKVPDNLTSETEK